MDENRRQELYDSWSAETNEPETEEWRDDLTPEEAALVDQWDAAFLAGYYKLCCAILDAEQRRNA